MDPKTIKTIQPKDFVYANYGGNHTVNYKGCPEHPGNKAIEEKRKCVKNTNNSKRVEESILAPISTHSGWVRTPSTDDLTGASLSALSQFSMPSVVTLPQKKNKPLLCF